MWKGISRVEAGGYLGAPLPLNEQYLFKKQKLEKQTKW